MIEHIDSILVFIVYSIFCFFPLSLVMNKVAQKGVQFFIILLHSTDTHVQCSLSWNCDITDRAATIMYYSSCVQTSFCLTKHKEKYTSTHRSNSIL